MNQLLFICLKIIFSKAGAHGSRGFGFVHFALLEDAEEAVRSFSGREINGRKMSVEIAKNSSNRDLTTGSSKIDNSEPKKSNGKLTAAKRQPNLPFVKRSHEKVEIAKVKGAYISYLALLTSTDIYIFSS